MDATGGKLTKGHTAEAMTSVWSTTKDVLSKAGDIFGGLIPVELVRF